MNEIVLKHRLQKGEFRLDVDTRIPGSGITGVFGESGSGKTTLLRCIAGLEKSVSNDERPIHKRQIGYVFQEPQLFEHLSVRKNIEYGLRRCGEPNVTVDDIVRLLELENLLARGTADLSGGEAQRVSIARALCRSPKLILMDEPLSGLDQRRKEEIFPYLDRLHAELSLPIVYVSHNIDEICRLGDHLLIIEGGRIVADGDLHSTLARIDLPQLTGDNAGAVVDARQIEYDLEFDLTKFAFSGGELWAPGKFEAAAVRLRVAASDVSLTSMPAEASTILNILPAVIDEIATESSSTTLIRLRLADDVLIARITKRSVSQLSLQVGAKVYAQIKSVTVRR